MTDAGSPARYEIRIDGVLNPTWFDGLEVDIDGRHTVISGWLADQSELHGLLAKIRDLGLCLITVRRLESPTGDHERWPGPRPRA
jgi:hypothetical protein